MKHRRSVPSRLLSRKCRRCSAPSRLLSRKCRPAVAENARVHLTRHQAMEVRDLKTKALSETCGRSCPGSAADGVRVAAEDGDADGLADVVVGGGPGAAPVIASYKGTTLTVLGRFTAF